MVNQFQFKLLFTKNRFYEKTGFLAMKFTILLLFVASVNIYAQQAQQGISITGTVTDRGEPLPGVNVSVKGTTIGMATNIDGKFEFTVPSTTSVLVFSYVGYVTTERTVGSQTVFNVELEEDAQRMDEVVVVGYGTQKKVNLTGAVAAVNVDETMTARSLANVSSGLQGLLPGLAVAQTSGMVGANNVSLMVRGVSSVNNMAPLIVVDGVPDVDINRLNMNDIESISVLKDAGAAAVYGSRAAAGVILITTRTGKNQDRSIVNFSASYNIGSPWKVINYMPDYPRALEQHRAALAVSERDESQQFKKGTVDQWLAMGMIDSRAFPNTYWWDWVYRKQQMQDYKVSASASNDRSNFFASVGVSLQEGIQVGNNYDIYTARFNYDYKIRHNMNIGFRFSGSWSKYDYFDSSDGFNSADSGGGTGDMQYAIAGITPYDPETGYFGGTMAYGEDLQAWNPYIRLKQNLNHNNRQEVLPSAYLEWAPFKGFMARVDYSINYFNQFSWSAGIPTQTYDFQINDFATRWYVGQSAGVSNTTNTGYRTVTNGRLNYNTTIATNHTLSLMALYAEEFYYSRSQGSSRNDRIHPSLTEINACLPDIQSASGSSSTEGLRSYVGRLNYTAYDKYLFEAVVRIDGSSRFYPGHRWGTFPSVSAGWNFTEENFVKPYTSSWLTRGKLRVSYGSAGEKSGVSNSEQKETLSTTNYMLGGTPVRGFTNTKMINQGLIWETKNTFNVGMELGFLKNRLQAEVNYYENVTRDMIRPSEMSIHLTGTFSAPRTNIGVMRVRGTDFNITWRERKGKFNYMLNFNGDYNKSNLDTWNEYLGRGGTNFINMPRNYIYTYKDIGIIQTWQEAYNYGRGSAPGDVVRLDLNGDGNVSGEDRVAYPNVNRTRPHTTFGLSGNASWNGIDIAFLFNGGYGRKAWYNDAYHSTGPNRQRYAFTWEHLSNIWTWDNRDGGWGRYGSGRDDTEFWLYDMSYLQLANLQLGYSIPKKWLNVVGMDNLRLYCTAERVFTLTKWPGIDPVGQGRNGRDDGGNMDGVYSSVRSFTFGINVTL